MQKIVKLQIGLQLQIKIQPVVKVILQATQQQDLISPTNAYVIDLGEDYFNEDEEDNMLEICVDKVTRDVDRYLTEGTKKWKQQK